MRPELCFQIFYSFPMMKIKATNGNPEFYKNYYFNHHVLGNLKGTMYFQCTLPWSNLKALKYLLLLAENNSVYLIRTKFKTLINRHMVFIVLQDIGINFFLRFFNLQKLVFILQNMTHVSFMELLFWESLPYTWQFMSMTSFTLALTTKWSNTSKLPYPKS
jgi:hypothetical protein